MANKDTIYLGLLGNPVAHSYSPLMHNAVFNKLNIKGFYLPFKVSSEQLHNAILGLQALVWAVSLSTMDLFTHCLTAKFHLMVFGVWDGSVTGEGP
jgi:shikimate 5-dehydrogenase